MRAMIAFGLGAAAMYLLDPEQGRRRRALLRERLAQRQRLAAQARRMPESARHLGR